MIVGKVIGVRIISSSKKSSLVTEISGSLCQAPTSGTEVCAAERFMGGRVVFLPSC